MCLKDKEKDNEEEQANDDMIVKETIRKIKNIVNFFKRSCQASGKLARTQIMLGSQ